MSDIDQSNLRRFIEQLLRRLLAEREPAVAKKRRLFVPEVLDVHPDRVSLEPSDGTDAHDRWFHKL